MYGLLVVHFSKCQLVVLICSLMTANEMSTINFEFHRANFRNSNVSSCLCVRCAVYGVRKALWIITCGMISHTCVALTIYPIRRCFP